MLIADWDVIITIFNFTILAISAYRMEKNLKQEQSAIIKLPCLDRKVLEKQL
jgi:uncharacterized membrane protein